MPNNTNEGELAALVAELDQYIKEIGTQEAGERTPRYSGFVRLAKAVQAELEAVRTENAKLRVEVDLLLKWRGATFNQSHTYQDGEE